MMTVTRTELELEMGMLTVTGTEVELEIGMMTVTGTGTVSFGGGRGK